MVSSYLKQFFPPLLIAFAQVSPSPCIIALASSGASSLVVVFLIGSELRNKKPNLLTLKYGCMSVDIRL